MTPHTCQAATVFSQDDPNFPDQFRKNPWCWVDGSIGFHRARNPEARHSLSVAKGTQLVGTRSITAALAISLGAGYGTTNAGTQHLGEAIERLAELTEYEFYEGLANPWAKFGHAAEYVNFRNQPVESLQKFVRILLKSLVLKRLDLPLRTELTRLAHGAATSRDLDGLRASEATAPLVGVLVEGLDYPGVVRVAYRLYANGNADAKGEHVDEAIKALTNYLYGLD